VQDHATQELDIEMAHAEHPLGGFAAHGESIGEDIVQGFALGQALLELGGLVQKLLVVERGHLGLENVDLVHEGVELFELLRIRVADDLRQQLQHGATSFWVGLFRRIIAWSEGGGDRPWGLGELAKLAAYDCRLST
jgi:hypothetical protein